MSTFIPTQRKHRFLALLTSSMLLLAIFVPPASAAKATQYTDVPEGAYYEDAAAALLLSGALDSGELLFRPGSLATRAEMIKLLVNAYGTTLLYPSTPSFDDISRTSWYYPYFETAAKEGWIRGDRNCYGTTQSNCNARPASSVNRAEMAIILERAFHLSHLNIAPIFRDNTDTGMWYHTPIQVAADHCVLQGDELGGFVRPASFMNRAEMVVMTHRAQQQLRYGQDCAAPTGQILGITTPSSRMIRVTFNTDMDPNRIDELSRYAVEEVNGSSIGVSDLNVINTRTVELSLNRALTKGTTYRLRVTSMLTEAGAVFSDTRTFVSTQSDLENPAIDSAVALSATMVRLTFSENLDEARAEDESRYQVERVSAAGTITVKNATLVGSRTVDVELNSSVVSQASYKISITSLMTVAGTIFNDSAIFSHPTTTTSHILNAEALSSTKVRITFNADLDEFRAEQTSRYAITHGSNSVAISSANLLSDERTVDLTLSEALTMQGSYKLNVTDLLTHLGVTFSDSKTFIFGTTSASLKATLRGLQEVPSVSTAASGTGTFTLTSAGLQYAITVQNLSGSYTAAHFHLGNTGANGAVIYPITFTGNSASGTWTTITDAERNSLLAGGVYVNVHTSKYPDGEIRGQLIVQ